MIKFIKKHKSFSAIIISILIIFLIAKLLEWNHYNKRLSQINQELYDKYGTNISYTVKDVKYAYGWGPLTDRIPFSQFLYRYDTFSLYDNTYHFDFYANINYCNQTVFQDSYVYNYFGKRVCDICLDNLSLPNDCNISFNNSFIAFNNEYFSELTKMSDDEIIDMFKQFNNAEDQNLFEYENLNVNLGARKISFSLTVNASEEKAKEVIYQTYLFMSDLFAELNFDKLYINNQIVTESKPVQSQTNENKLNKEEFLTAVGVNN